MRQLAGWTIAAACALLLLVLAAAFVTQRDPVSYAPPLSSVAHTCPHHPDVIESSPGTCPFCKMTLVPVRLAAAWTCPVHPVTIQDDAGSCPICRRQLVPVTASLTWTCTGSPTEHLEPGLCSDGQARVLARTLRPHGDHNPRHGGQFFMAPDNWHHVEGTYPATGVFRFYVYDDYARPLPDAQLRALRARVVTSEQFDPATGQAIEETSFPLRIAQDGGHLEAQIGRASLPAEMTAKIQFASGADEYRFDFTFLTASGSPAPADNAASPPPATAPPVTIRAAAPDAPSSGSPIPDPRSAIAGPRSPIPDPRSPVPDPRSPTPDPALIVLPVPGTVAGILEQLRERRRHVAELIDRGDFAAVWVPAFAARDLAIALEPHLDRLDGAVRDTAGPALQRTVRLAWLLDAQGDGGNRQQLAEAFAAFAASVDQVVAAFEPVKAE
jgi:hypothetical protein